MIRALLLIHILFLVMMNVKAQQKKQSNGLPAGYDDTWKVSIYINTILNTTRDVTDKNNSTTTKESSSTQISALLGSNKNVSHTEAREITIYSYGDGANDELKKYTTPLTGKASITYKSNKISTHSFTDIGTEGAADEKKTCTTKEDLSYSGNLDLSEAFMTLNYGYSADYGKDNVVEAGLVFSSGKATMVNAMGKRTYTCTHQKPETTDLSGNQYCQPIDVKLITYDSNAVIINDPKLYATGAFSSVGVAKFKQNKSGGYYITFSDSQTFTNEEGTTFTKNTSVTVTYSKNQNLEAIIEPYMVHVGTINASGDYDNWIPEGPSVNGQDDTKKGNSIGFRIKILDKKTGEDVTGMHPFTVTYTLDEVSKYKGYCMNYPAKDVADDKPDLRWENDGYIKSNDNKPAYADYVDNATETVLKSKPGKGANLPAILVSYDYAAFGILKANVHLEDDDLDLTGHLKDKVDPDARIPKDDNGNKIADYWENDIVHTSETDPNFDEDEFPQKQKRNGDGYTMWEEYRGFKVEANLIPPGCKETFKNGLVRMDPNYKDIFIWDRDGLFKTYAAPENPSDLCWHYINNNEMVYLGDGVKSLDNRWVNFNYTQDYYYAKQYSLVLKANNTVPQNYDCDSSVQTGVSQNYNNIYDWNLGSELSEDEEDNYNQITGYNQAVKHFYITIINVGMTTYCMNRFNYGKDLIYYEFLHTVNHEIGHSIGIPHHMPLKTSGSFDCCIRYSTEDQDKHRIYSHIAHYCRANEGFDCYGKIDVKSDPD